MPSPTRPRTLRIVRLNSLAVEIERRKVAIAKERDALRALLADATDIVECADEASDELESATQAIERAVDALSRYL